MSILEITRITVQDSSGSFETIAANTPNDGEYNWTIQSTPSHNCMLKIEPLSDPDKGTVQGLFTILDYIQATPSSLGLTEPALPGDTPESQTFKVLLASDPGGDLELELAASNPGECSVSPTSITLNSGNWNSGVEVTVTPEYDGIADGDQITAILASTVDGFGSFQANELPLVQIIVQDADTRTTLQTVSPSFGEAGQPLAVTVEGTNFTTSTSIAILPDGGSATYISPVTYIDSTTLSFTIPAQTAGTYNLKAGSFELKNAVTFADTASADAQERKKAIVVAGGGPYHDNSLWLATKKCMDKAYTTLLFSGYDADTVQLLSRSLWSDITGDGENDIDDTAGIATLQAAISGLNAANTDELLLYMVGPGADGRFQFGSDANPEYLTPAVLDGWLDALQADITGRVVVIFDACQAGSFVSQLAPPDGKDRIVIAGAGAAEPAWFLDDGEISFSYRFFDHLFDRAELFAAFDKAKNDVLQLQTPQIAEFTGDTQKSTMKGGDDPIYIGRGRIVEVNPPSILDFTASPPVLDDGSTASTLAASGVEADAGLSHVWCRIIPPLKEFWDPAAAIILAPTMKLLDIDEDGVYDNLYEEFAENGIYQAIAYAADLRDSQSIPRMLSVTQSLGIYMEIQPGDVNVDGTVDLSDAVRALQVTVGMHPHALKQADVNNDGRIGVTDALYVLRKAAGL